MHRFVIRAALAAVAALALGSAAGAVGSPDKGKAAFIKNGCFQCHGTVGQGSVATSRGKVLYDTELPLEAFIGFVRGTNRAMPAYGEKILSDADLTDIWAYLESLPKTPDYKTIPLLNQQ
jgi:ubiquinol-cytochrome c reductase cytochrome c subunit